MSMWSRIVRVFRMRDVDLDIDEELQSHLDEARAVGRDPSEAARAFGSRLRTRESVHDVVIATWLESLLADAIFGWRQLRKHKTTSTAAILSLALGIGSCTAAFRLIDALLLRPLPVADPGRLYVLSFQTQRSGKPDIGDSFDYPGFREMRGAAKADAELIAISYPGRIDLTYGSDMEMEKAHRQYVSGWLFSELGLKPALGRLFTESDDLKPGAHPYAVLSYDYWQRRFGKDPGVIGRTFRNGDDLYQIVGVAPQGFTGTETGTITDVFVPTMMIGSAIDNPHIVWFRTWVRLKPRSSPERVRQQLAAALRTHRQEQLKSGAPGMPKRDAEEYLSAPIFLEPASAGMSTMQRTYRRALTILAVLVALVLLIASANVANLMTAQAAARAREMALRVSIGAGRGRLIQLVLMESALIAGIASGLGILFAWWAAPLVVGMINPPNDPAHLILPADWRVIGFAVVLTFAVTLLFGLAPALRASSVKPASALKGGEDPHERRRLMNALVAAQVAFCFLVHFVAGLFISTFEKLANQPTGFSAARVLTLETATKTKQPFELWDQVTARLGAFPGVESAALANWALMAGSGWNGYVWANGHSPEGMTAPWFLAVSPRWFDTMKIPLVGGRDFRHDDVYPQVAVVNETFARRYFDGQNPVGQTFETMSDGTHGVTVRIVGYVGDARYLDMRTAIRPTVYMPFRTTTGPILVGGGDMATFIVRTNNPNPLVMASALRQEIPRARPEFRVSNIRTQAELVRAQTIRERMLAMLSLFFAVVALVLAGVGLYGVLDYAVLERRRELGIRIALGAQAGDVARRVTIEVFAMLALGSSIGLSLGIASQSYVSTLLYQIKATDPSIIAAPAITILAAALLAALPPVFRAIRIDPVEMLRSE
jgi:predicted permease